MWNQFYQSIHVQLILILCFLHSSSVGENPSKEILWSWECLDNRCVPSHAIRNKKAQSLETCNMLCSSMQLWPQPTGPVSLSTTAVPVRADFIRLQTVNAPSKHVYTTIEDAFELFINDLRHLEAATPAVPEFHSLSVYIKVNESDDSRLLIDTNEGYALILYPKPKSAGQLVVKIHARSFCGARHGLETLEQLIWFDSVEGSLVVLEAAKIQDQPKFSYRGLLVDSARNFIPVPDIMRTIDAMAACKLNTFHWRISDAESFPLKLANVPELNVYGAYGSGAKYTTGDVREIVQRARVRGIRVLIEVDTPAHVGRAWIWGKSQRFTDLVYCTNVSDWKQFCKSPPCGQLNPRNPHVYDILEQIYKEIFQLTGVQDVFHIGGDDVSASCWKKHFPNVDTKKLLKEHTDKVIAKLESINGKLPNLTIMWLSPLSDDLSSEFGAKVAHIGLQTRNMDSISKVYLNSLRVIVSQADFWDLNSGTGDWFEESYGLAYNSWQRMYDYRPWGRGTRLASAIIGGEATAWSGQLGVGGLDARVWPRAAALAERLWSDRGEGSSRSVHARLDVHRQRLVARGLHAAPVWAMWCSHYTHTCG